MIKKLLIITLLAFDFTLVWADGNIICPDDKSLARDSIAATLEFQLNLFPQSEYRDVYKHFMQDYFGPGHILTDTIAARNYLRRELNESEIFDGPIYVETGYRGNFYRVNLSLIKEGVIPFDLFFNAFVRSVQNIEPPSSEEWIRTWSAIDEVIAEKNLHFPNESTDKTFLAEQFSNGNFIMHHSRRFNESTNFHYRIISRDEFHSSLLPLIRAKLEPKIQNTEYNSL